jgi:aminoglycoside phosphotransferase (APT) family kinase protein
VVVKRPCRESKGWDHPPSDAARATYANERACLELLGSTGAAVAPAYLGACDDPELLVMEALPPGRSLAALLLADDEAAARAAVVAFAEALATMHASTIGRESTFAGKRSGPWAEWMARGVDPWVDGARALGVPFDAGALRAECSAVIAEVADGGRWRAFVHGDPCPDNTRIEDATGRFRIFDFEHSGYGHALADASYVVAPFPSCWCIGRVPHDLSQKAVTAYRAVLAPVVPEAADDDEWDAAMTVALAAPILARGESFARALADDGEWGTTGLRPRLLQWMSSFLLAAEGSGRFPALRDLVDRLASELAQRWPDADLPDYPGLPAGGASVAVAPDWWTPES